MTDHELLKLAAKAIHLDHHIDHLDGCLKIVADGHVWRPLISDRDAFRLAAALGLMVDWSIPGRIQCAGPCGIALEAYFDEPAKQLDATRLAIVRVAAEVGKTK